MRRNLIALFLLFSISTLYADMWNPSNGVYKINKFTNQYDYSAVTAPYSSNSGLLSGMTTSQIINAVPTPDLSGYVSTTTATANYVPYLGANTNVNIGTNTLTCGSLFISTTTNTSPFTLLNTNASKYAGTILDTTANGAFMVFNSLNSGFGGFRFQANGIDRYTLSRSNDTLIYSCFNSLGVWQGDTLTMNGSLDGIFARDLTVTRDILGTRNVYTLAPVIQNASKNSNVVMYNGGSSGNSILITECPSGSEKMRLVGSSGFVGIGKTPTERLEVNGNIKATYGLVGSTLVISGIANITGTTTLSTMTVTGKADFVNNNSTVTVAGILDVTGKTQIRLPYAAYYSTTTQTIAVINTTQAITLDGKLDTGGNAFSYNSTCLTCNVSGEYLIGFSAVPQGTNGNKLYVFPRINNVDVPYSNTKWSFAGTSAPKVMTVFYNLDLNVGDVLCFIMYSDNTNSQLLAEPASTTPIAPAMPSIIVTINKTGEIQ